MRKLARRLAYLFQRNKFEQELAEEMAAHREQMGDRNPNFGNAQRLREEARDAWGWNWLDEFVQDIAYGARQLRRAPGFTLVAVAVLALGVGLNLSVYHVVNAIFYDRIPVADSETLMRIARVTPEGERGAFPPEMVEYLSSYATSFDYIVGERTRAPEVLLEDDVSSVRAQFVNGNYFSDLRLKPAAGRLLTSDDNQPGAPLAVVLGNGYWKRQFGEDLSIVGETLRVNGIPVPVVGIAPQRFEGLGMSAPSVWFARNTLEEITGEAQNPATFSDPDTSLFATLRPGVTAVEAEAELHRLTINLLEDNPELFGDIQSADALTAQDLTADRLDDQLQDQANLTIRPLDQDQYDLGPYPFMMALAGLVLLSACANLGNMLLARARVREGEFASRLALGATRFRIVRQLLTENLLLAILGGFTGATAGRVGAEWLAATFSPQNDLRIAWDLRIIVVAIAITLFSMVAFGLIPALRAAMKAHRDTRSRQWLIGVQVATSCVLLILSGLFTRAGARQASLAEGGPGENIIAIDLNLEETSLNPPAAEQIQLQTAATLEQMDQIEGVSMAWSAPVFGPWLQRYPGYPAVYLMGVEPGYFEVMQLSLLRGRLFAHAEKDVILISQSAAQLAYTDQDPLGQIWDPGESGAGPTVIGVVSDSVAAEARDPKAIEGYIPMREGDYLNAVLLARTRTDPHLQLKAVRDTMNASSLPGTPPASVWLLQRDYEALSEHARDATQVMSVMGAAGALLSGIGIFGLVAFSVAERKREIGIRMALGAQPGNTMRFVLGACATPFTLGILVGVVLAVAGEISIGSFSLLGVGLTDPAAYLYGVGAFLLIALIAVWLPVRRALRVDPATTLRSE